MKTKINAAKRILKNSKKTAPDKPTLHYPQILDDGRQCIMDQCHAVVLVPGNVLPLDPMPDDVRAKCDLFPIDDTLKRAKTNNAKRALPCIADLKEYIKEIKAKKSDNRLTTRGAIIYDFGDNLPAVNAAYLLDMLQLMPDAIAFVDTRKPLINAVYFSDGTNKGVLLPMRKLH